MSGQIKSIIDRIIRSKAQGDRRGAYSIRAKLLLKGIDPQRYTASSPDDPTVLARLEELCKEWRVDLGSERPRHPHMRSSFTTAPEISAAVAGLVDDFTDLAPSVVVYFASPRYPGAELAAAVRDAFPHARTFGCSSAGEITDGRLRRHSISAFAMSRQVIDQCAVAVARPLAGTPDLGPAIADLERQLGRALGDLSMRDWQGMVLIDGTSQAEERVMDALGDRSEVLFVGGSAGDDLLYQRTWIYADGAAHDNAALLCVMRPTVPFRAVKTQSFDVLPQRLVATAVDSGQRIVHRFDDRPALDAYAEALGLTHDEATKRFDNHPLGLMLSDEPYVRGIQRRFTEDGRMHFFSHILEGTALNLLCARDIVGDTAAFLAEQRQAMGTITGALCFNCIQRSLELQHNDQIDDYAEIFRGMVSAGFSTYGEQYLGHVNQTLTMVLFS